MAALQKKYFLAPHWDYEPDKHIRLGNIIAAPCDPVPALAEVGIEPEIVRPVSKFEVDWTHERAKHDQGGLFTSFLQQFLGPGADISGGSEHMNAHNFKFSELETREFWPSQEYVELRMSDHKVQEFVRRLGWLDRSVYMIIGIKIARGATMRTRSSNGQFWSTAAGIDATTVGAPGSLGVEYETGRSYHDQASWTAHSDIIFAYRLVRISQRWNSIRARDYTKGAMHGTSRPYQAEEGEKPQYIIADVL